MTNKITNKESKPTSIIDNINFEDYHPEKYFNDCMYITEEIIDRYNICMFNNVCMAEHGKYVTYIDYKVALDQCKKEQLENSLIEITELDKIRKSAYLEKLDYIKKKYDRGIVLDVEIKMLKHKQIFLYILIAALAIKAFFI